MLTIYLAGAIRDDHWQADVKWREDLIAKIRRTPYRTAVRILNPLGDKTYNPTIRLWRMGGRMVTDKGIVHQDVWCVRQADLIVANLSAMASGYPCIGTLVELGIAVGMGGKLIYTIGETAHPFLDLLVAERFSSVEACWAFLERHLGMLTARQPSFGGVGYD